MVLVEFGDFRIIQNKLEEVLEKLKDFKFKIMHCVFL